MRHGSDWYKREPVAYLGGVQGLSAKEHAVYSVTLDLIYVHGGSINNDPGWIAGWISDMGPAAVRKAIASLCARGKLMIIDGQITQKRAKSEAKTKENVRETVRENGKKGGKKSAELRAESIKNKDLGEAEATSENQAEKRREEKRRKGIGGGGSARASQNVDVGFSDGTEPPPQPPPQPPPKGQTRPDRERLLEAIGADPISGMIGPSGHAIGRMADMIEARKWQDDLGLSMDEICDVIREVMAKKTDGSPSAFSYFTAPMQRFAGQKNRPPLTPIEGGKNDRSDQKPRSRTDAGPGGAHSSFLAAFTGRLPNDT